MSKIGVPQVGACEIRVGEILSHKIPSSHRAVTKPDPGQVAVLIARSRIQLHLRKPCTDATIGIAERAKVRPRYFGICEVCICQCGATEVSTFERGIGEISGGNVD